MKSKLLFLFSFISFFTCLSQTQAERNKITSTYQQEEINSLNSYLDSIYTARQIELDEYFLNNPNKKKRFTDDKGRIREAKFIYNNMPIYVSTDDVQSLNITRANYLVTGGGLGLNLDGQNMQIGIWDGGHALTSHQEFLDDQPMPESIITIGDSPYTPGDHASNVTGITVARGVVANAKGIASQATAVSYDWNADAIEVSNAANAGLLISNHSYGVPTQDAATWVMGCYDNESVAWDNIATTYPYFLPVMSAGNSGAYEYTGGLGTGLDKLTYEKNAKNILTVGSANSPSITSSGEVVLPMYIAEFSSQGPTDDGRVKPDVVGDGFGVYSAASTNSTAYVTMSGTSQASPSVASSLLLLQQYYNQLHASYMRASTLKGLVCHTASDDHLYIGPDPYWGWGLINAKFAAETILKANQQEALIQENTLNSGQVFSYTFISDGSGPLMATICWTDPAGTAKNGLLNDPSPALVNDLDIRVTNETTSTEYFPYKLNLSNPGGIATTGDNSVDNVEKIEIDFPSAGTYTITISHKSFFLTGGTQDYALILTGEGVTLSNQDYAITDSDYKVWPNPVKDKLNYSFQSNSNESLSVELIDIKGRVIYSSGQDVTSNLVYGNIDMSNVAKGVYFIKFNQGTNTQLSKVVHY